MQMTEQQVLEQALTCSRLASENYTFRDMVVQLQAMVQKLQLELDELKTPIEGLDEAETKD